MPSRRSVLAFGMLCLWASAPGAARAAPDDAAYRRNWFQCAAAMALLARRDGFDPMHPTAEAKRALAQATDRLEAGVSAMMRAIPPADSAAMHVVMLPRLQEVVAAARDMLAALDVDDLANTIAAMHWLDDALDEANRTLNAQRRGELSVPEH